MAGDDTLVRQNTDKLPGNVLTINLKKIWEVIKDQKDLNLPAHKVRLALTYFIQNLISALIYLQEMNDQVSLWVRFA